MRGAVEQLAGAIVVWALAGATFERVESAPRPLPEWSAPTIEEMSRQQRRRLMRTMGGSEAA